MSSDLVTRSSQGPWHLFIDTGGTFTDCLGRDPEGQWHRAKVLSSSALRAVVTANRSPHELAFQAAWKIPPGFADAASLLCPSLGFAATIAASGPDWLRVDRPLPASIVGERIELSFAEEAPVLAARLLVGAAKIEDLPPIALRLATTKGTNALLERQGAKVAWLVTAGFADLLQIGDQQRPDLFALAIEKKEPLYHQVLEVDERLQADGQILRELDLSRLESQLATVADCTSYALSFLHSYLNPRHELAVAQCLRARGARYISCSSELAPTIEILARARTAVVDAYLAPILGAYLDQVQVLAQHPASSLLVMSSAGSLASPAFFRAKDSLLSGPAGGVLGVAAAGRAVGLTQLIGFDMGGTSTDVCRYAGALDYRYEQKVGDARLASPTLAIETVAAGGGSVCELVGGQWKVGPRSAGARPGPACYGGGGPLTLTDVNLLLGRLIPTRFTIPLDPEASARALDALLSQAGSEVSAATREALLDGLLQIANERMAEAIRRISVRQGHDPAAMTLVAFGGAGGQHACAVAELLGIRTLLLPVDAGLLSARGLIAARREKLAQKAILAPLADQNWPTQLESLIRETRANLVAEGCGEPIELRRCVALLRLTGQEHALEVEIPPSPHTLPAASDALAAAYLAHYERLFGYRAPARPLELVELRVVLSSGDEELEAGTLPPREGPLAKPLATTRAYFSGQWLDVPSFTVEALDVGEQIRGPALVFEAHASLTLTPGWQASRSPAGSIVAWRVDD